MILVPIFLCALQCVGCSSRRPAPCEAIDDHLRCFRRAATWKIGGIQACLLVGCVLPFVALLRHSSLLKEAEALPIDLWTYVRDIRGSLTRARAWIERARAVVPCMPDPADNAVRNLASAMRVEHVGDVVARRRPSNSSCCLIGGTF